MQCGSPPTLGTSTAPNEPGSPRRGSTGPGQRSPTTSSRRPSRSTLCRSLRTGCADLSLNGRGRWFLRGPFGNPARGRDHVGPQGSARLAAAGGARTLEGSCQAFARTWRRTPPSAGPRRCLCERPHEHSASSFIVALLGKRLHQPEGANEECALGPVETVARHPVGAIPQDQAVFCQRLCDGIHCGDHPMVVGRQEAD